MFDHVCKSVQTTSVLKCLPMFSSQDLDVPTCPHLKAANFTHYNLCNVPPHVPRRFMTRICQSALAVQETITSSRICWELVAQCCSSCSYFAMGATGFKNPRRQLWGKRCRCHIQSPLQPVTSAAKDRQYCKWCTFASMSALKNSRCIAQNIALLCSSKNQLLVKELSSDLRFFGKFTAWGLISIWKIMHWILQNWSCWRTWP